MAATVALELIGHRHQPLAAGVRLGERLDLLRDIVDALIEVAPVADQVLDRVQQARGKGIGASGQDARQLCPQAVETLGDACRRARCCQDAMGRSGEETASVG
jgi:hypothetical protein